MAAVIVTTTTPRRSTDRSAPRPPLQVIPGGRAAARARARALRSTRPVSAGVYRRRRIGALLVVTSLALVAYLVVAGLVATVGDVSGSAHANHPVAAGSAGAGAVHVVQPGDTLWSIARSLHPHGDLRIVVDRLEARLGGATLQPGQRVALDGLTS